MRTVLRYLIPALILINVALLLRLVGLFPQVFGDPTDPGRIARQINPEQLHVSPARR
jgi:hypothetical protein